jgi:3-methyladenine DNA glycosylase AlkD
VTKKNIDTEVQAALAWLKRTGSKTIRDDMGPKYGIHVEQAFGVSMANMKILAKKLGTDHELAAALWDTGWYEARMLACMIDDPAEVSTLQMDKWCADFDNWGICDTVCFNLFDRTPYAWKKLAAWSKQDGEFQKRTAFALLWSLTVHDKKAEDSQFIKGLALIEHEAQDERHFVKKSVNMALRAIGKRNAALNEAATMTAQRLAESSDATARWIGKDALRELTSPVLIKRLSEQAILTPRSKQ